MSNSEPSLESRARDSGPPESRAQLLEWARSYRAEYRRRLREELEREWQERHARGETYYDGIWIPRSKLAEVERALAARSRLLRIEICALVVVVLIGATVVWWAFGALFMPYY